MGGRSRRPPANIADSDSDEGRPSKSVIFLSSSDDEEANRDLSLEIVERAMERESKRKRTIKNEVSSISPESIDDVEVNFERGDVEEERKKKKTKGKSKKKKEIEAVSAEDVDAAAEEEEEPLGTADSIVTEVNDNVVLRKLLRGPRYFDPGERDSSACFNCGEEGHAATNCMMEKRKRPCFICGMFGHIAKRCTQGQDCFICKRRGHIAKNCPEKNKHISQDSVICLRCGDLGHEMLSCKNDYTPEDLKHIQCYVCKNYGHLCCVDSVDNSPREVSCYNCSQTGHTGVGCAKRRGEVTDVASSTVCFKCGEEGHFARGCTNNLKYDRSENGSSTPWRLTNENKESLGFRSVPNDFGKARKNKKTKFHYGDECEDKYEERWKTSSSKPRIRGGWIVDNPGNLSRRLHAKVNRWNPQTTPTKNSHKPYSPASGGYFSTPQSPFRKQKSFMGTPNSNASTSRHRNGYSTPRYYGRSQGYYERT